MAVVKNNGIWVYEWRIGGRKIRRSTGLRVDEVSRDEVRKREAEERRKAAASLRLSGSAPLLSEAIDRFYRERWSKQRDSVNPVQRAQEAMRILGDKPLDSITSNDLQRLKNKLAERGLSGSTINRYMSAILAILNHASRYWEVLDRVPAVRKESEKYNARQRIITEEEEARLLNVIDDEQFKRFLIVLIDAGLRRQEALTLTWSRGVDFSRNALIIHEEFSKGKRTRAVPMTKRVRAALVAQRETATGDVVFPYSKDAVTHRFQAYLRLAGLPITGPDKITLHATRHTFASRLAQRKVPIYTVKELLGHASVTTTEKHYAHLFLDNLRDSIQVLDR